MGRSATLARAASVIMMGLGAGHLLILAVTNRADLARWRRRGGWAAVPLVLDQANVAKQSVPELRNEVTFWAGPGGFSAPLILLGALIWRLAGRGIPIPAGIGWGVTGWCVAGGVLLVPSPFFVGSLAGVLLILSSTTRSGQQLSGRKRRVPRRR